MIDIRDNPWKLRGSSRQLAVFTAAALAVATVLVAVADRYTATGWGSPFLEAWTLVPQVMAAAGLFYIARKRDSTAFLILGILIALIIVEEVFHVLNPLAAWLAEVGRSAQSWTDVRVGLLNGVLIYGFVALVGLSLLAFSHWRGSPAERPVVRKMTLLLLLGGLFGGPVSVVSTMSDPLRWMFIEELGESLVFAVIAGYVTGLVALVNAQRLSHLKSDRPWSPGPSRRARF